MDAGNAAEPQALLQGNLGLVMGLRIVLVKQLILGVEVAAVIVGELASG